MSFMSKTFTFLVVGGLGYGGYGYYTDWQEEQTNAQQAARSEESARRADDAVWARVQRRDSIESYHAYLLEQMDGAYLNEAYERLEGLRRSAAIDRQLDDAAWMTALSGNTAESMTRYLTSYRNGVYVEFALSQRNRLQDAEREHVVAVAEQVTEVASPEPITEFAAPEDTADTLPLEAIDATFEDTEVASPEPVTEFAAPEETAKTLPLEAIDTTVEDTEVVSAQAAIATQPQEAVSWQDMIVQTMLITAVQVELDRLGYDVGEEEGILTPATATAISAYQSGSEMSDTGDVDEALLTHLEATLLRPAARDIEDTNIGTIFRDCDACPEMVVVPKGSFVMGYSASDTIDGEQPGHEVVIDYRMAVAVYEVSHQDWNLCVEAGVCAEEQLDTTRPANQISWNDAQQYAAWLSEVSGEDYRLPSEAEWEYFTRAGTTTTYNTGDSINGDQAQYRFSLSAKPVGSFAANPWGIFDTHGNVAEWVEDCWHESYDGAPEDGSSWGNADGSSCAQYAQRGGSWSDRSPLLGSANRSHNAPESRNKSVGFRLVKTLS